MVILSWINFLVCKILHPSIDFKGTGLYNFWIRVSKGNSIAFKQSNLTKTRINVNGSGNTVNFTTVKVSDSIIDIYGKNNTLALEEGVVLRKSNIIIRGNNCKVQVGNGSTFGSVRIVNVGTKNPIMIGRNCLFSDHIEIWASDTHAIYDENGNWINQERPVTIGDKVWVGSHVKILKGVNIGDGAVLGMGAMVTKNVPENSLVVGAPARVLKQNVTWSLEYPEA